MVASTWIVALVVAAAATEPESDIEQGRRLIRDLHEEEAILVLRPVVTGESLPTERARAAVYLGVAQLNLGDEPGARASFAQALELDRGATAPEWVSRKVRAIFDEEVKRQTDELARRLAAERLHVSAENGALLAERTRLQEQQRLRAGLPLQQAQKPRLKPSKAMAVGLLIGAAVSAAVCAVGFTEWGFNQSRAQSEPVALTALELNSRAQKWWYAGEVGGISASALGLAGGAIMVWAVTATPTGVRIVAQGSF